MASVTMPRGLLKVAAAAGPSRAPPTREKPASVVTAEVARAMARMQWPALSATYKVSKEGASPKPQAWLKDAASPMPSTLAAVPEPASVVTMPAGVTSRTRLLD